MLVEIADRTGAAGERLHWAVDVGARSHGLDLIPGILGRSVAIEVDARRVGSMPEPTPQRPWRERDFAIAGEPVVVGLTWHAPVMHTDVFVGGRSLRDGRTLESVRSDAPKALANYEVWLGGLFALPFIGSRPRAPRFGPVLIGVSAAVWLMAMIASPVPPGLRIPVAVALVATAVVLVLSFLWAWVIVAERIHLALLVRPQIGDVGRVVAFFAGFVAYPLVVMPLVGSLLWLLSR